jgi:amino acid adenylation domain-containing protein
MRQGFLLSQNISAVAPGSIALRHGSSTLTYGELNRKADQLAAHLRSLGVGPEASVAICLCRSFDQIVAALAAMRAGAAFVPIDPALPDQRIQHIVADSGAAVLVAPAALTSRIEMAAVALDLAVSAVAIEAAGEVAGWPGGGACGDLAYIIYTSGSTGVPKGVEITHGNLRHLVEWHVGEFGVTAADHATHVAGVGFDASVWEIWPYLSVGACISLADDMTRIDSNLLRQWIVDQKVTIAFVPTPVAEPMLAMDWPATTKLRTLLTGGDTLHVGPRAGLPFRVVNNYGPTECTVVAASGHVSSEVDGLPSIGKAIKGAAIYLLNDEQQPVLAGEVGEMYVGGDGVGRGYRNLPEMTAQHFLPNPFEATPDARMYRTGDMAMLQPDGQIAFLGRNDGQEKIRGNRIELDEIVSVLNRHADVVFNVVVTRVDERHEKYLVAYVLLAEGAEPNAGELREFAAELLPSYMIPAKFVRLTALPLSTNGKTDRRALPEPGEENLLAEGGSRESESEIEVAVLQLVRGLLKMDEIGIEDDFFLVGGHSLLGTQLVMKVRETFGVMLTLRDLFEAGTVAGLAERIEELLLAALSDMSEEEALRLAAAG